jgi:hypothetical protein
VTTTELPLPPLLYTASGAMRRIGVELELTGLDVEALSAQVALHAGGRVARISRYEHVVHAGGGEDWGVELDFAYLKQKGRLAQRPPAPSTGGQPNGSRGDALGALDGAAEELLRLGAEQVVPFEVVSPPLPMDRLAQVQGLVGRLRAAGARGTGDGLVYAFGLQLNPEVPATDAATLARYLKAFFCLYDWLKARARVDLTRRLTAYVDPFPRDYLRRVVDPAYGPDLPTLIDHYLAANPTRNRALDLLPLFLHLDPDRVRKVVDDPRVKPRPALHYRLPNCEIDRPDWGIHLAWRDWLQVEHLVAVPQRLKALCTRYAEHLDRPLGGLLEDWTEQVEPWLKAPQDL